MDVLKTERRFFTIVRWFGLIVASLALGCVILAAIFAAYKAAPNTGGSVRTPTVTYDDFRKTTEVARTDVSNVGADQTLAKKQADADKANAAAAFEKRLEPHLSGIVSDLTNYSSKLGQAKPSAQAVGDFVRKNMNDIANATGNWSNSWDFAERLGRATHDLSADADRLYTLNSDDARRVKWPAFLEWFTRNYRQQIGAEMQRIHSERARSVVEAAQVPGLLYSAAIAFGVFIVATLLMLLARIEMNTRST